MKPSMNIALATTDPKGAIDFYKNTLSLKPSEHMEGCVSFGPINLIIDDDPRLTGPTFEFTVEDVEAAREYLEKAGCKVIRWEGQGRCCYMQDPYGFRFNLWQD